MAAEPPQHIAYDLLARAQGPEAADEIFQDRVKQRPLYLRPISPDPADNARSRRQYERLKKERAQRKSKKPKPLSAKRKRALCLDEIPKEQRKYALYEPLNKMWCEYMQEILNIKEGKRQYLDGQSAGPFLASADYHGAILEIIRSRCPTRVGLKGLVLRDTKFTFELITKENELKTVPKEHTIFRFEVPFPEQPDGPKQTAIFDIIGDQFIARAPDRATRKFRLHIDSEL